MALLLHNLQEIITLAVWVGLWAAGGVWLGRAAFNLRPNEEVLAGFAIGLIVENWLANLLGRFLAPALAFWLAAAVVFAAGLALALGRNRAWRSLFAFRIVPLQWLAVLAVAFAFNLVGNGLAILDDYQNLPVTSFMAAGDIPPSFPLDPSVNFGYHYFTQLFSAQLIPIAGLHPWNALDLTRALGLALTVTLWGLFAQRLTRSALAGFVTGVFLLFAGGTRWLLLLLPKGVLEEMSLRIRLIGSGLASAPDLQTALISPLGFDGGGPFPIPFAFANAVNTPLIWGAHSGSGGLKGVILGLLILTHNRRRGPAGWVLLGILLASLAIAYEVSFFVAVGGIALVALIELIRRKSLRLPPSLWRWVALSAVVSFVALFQGGVISGVLANFLRPAAAAADRAAYFTFGFAPLWPPAVLSGHLGFLSLADPYQLLAALLEIGPILLVLPLMLVYASKALRSGRWYEAGILFLPLLSLLTLFVRYTGNAGPTALVRLESLLIDAANFWAVPLLWLWAAHRSGRVQALAAALLAVAAFGGAVLFGNQMTAAPKPIFSTFVSILDTRMEKLYWNRLEPGVLIFDPAPPRAATLFARPTDSNLTWYVNKPAWEELLAAPDPYRLQAAGYSYLYLDLKYWDEIEAPYRQKLERDPCVRLVQELKWDSFPYDFRRLYDIRACR